MQLSYHHASVCANFSYSFLKKVVSDQRWPTAPLFIMNINLSFREITAPLCHILPIHNVTINSNNLYENFHWMFTFCSEKSYDGTHLTFGRTLDWRRHFKYVSLHKANSTLSNNHGSQVQDQGQWHCCIKNFPISLNVMCIYFLDTPRKYRTYVTEVTYVQVCSLLLVP